MTKSKTKIAPHRCRKCKQWIFSTTLGSPDIPEWHCRNGFSPSANCQEMADYNIKRKREYYRKHPEELQLKLKFKENNYDKGTGR